MDFSKGSPEERTDMLSRAFWLYGVGKQFMITQAGRSYRSSGRGAQTQTQDGSNTPPIGITEEEARMLPFDTLHIILEKPVSRTQMMQALDPPGHTKKPHHQQGDHRLFCYANRINISPQAPTVGTPCTYA